MNKRPDRRGKVLFINAVNEVARKNAQSYLEDQNIQKIADAYKKYETDDNFAKVVTIKDIEQNNFSLSIPLYVKEPASNTETDMRSLQERYTSWSAASVQMHNSYALLNQLLGKDSEANV